MQLPDNFTVPDFILQHVLVAPEEWLDTTDSAVANERLIEIRKCLQNPDVLYCICVMVKNLAIANNQIQETSFVGLHDVFNQQQLIGEMSGLRQFFSELLDIHNKLVEVTKL